METRHDSSAARHRGQFTRRANADQRFRELVIERATELAMDARRFLEWTSERGFDLADIVIKSNTTERRISALAALAAHAPTWLREAACYALSEGQDIEGETVYIGCRLVELDLALVAHAPTWLRNELADWLSQRSQLEDEVEVMLAAQRYALELCRSVA